MDPRDRPRCEPAKFPFDALILLGRDGSLLKIREQRGK
jgi:hypothetical protein